MKLNKYFKSIWTKEIKLFLICYIIYIPFHLNFEELILNNFIYSFLTNCQSNNINDFLFSIPFIYAIYFFFNKKVIPSFSSIIIITLCTTIYVYYRFSYRNAIGEPWEFTSFGIIPKLKYADGVFLIFLSFLTKKIVVPSELKITGDKKLIEDNFRTFNKQDLLKRESFAIEIANYIKGSTTYNSFAIGLIGKWGNGKTIFLNFIENALSNDEFITIKFNPWRSKSPKIIIDDFFNAFIAKLNLYDPKISSQIEKYANSIKAIEDNYLAKSIKEISDLFIDPPSIQNRYTELEHSLTKLNKRIVIFIDDVDRLNEEEILEILRIVRNAANFPNTFFLVAFDKNYVLKAISNHNNINSENYLEKIFQLEIQLPYYQESIVYSTLLDLLRNNRSISEFKEIENAINIISNGEIGDDEVPFSTLNSNFIKLYLANLRDVVRFVNSFNLNYNFTKSGEVDLADFIILELIKIKFTGVFNLLAERKFLSNTRPGSTTITTFDFDSASKYFNNESSSLFIPKDQVELVTNSILFLFNPNRQRNSLRSILYSENFLLYFSPEIFNHISFKEFKNLRNSNLNDYFKKLDLWIEQGKKQDILNIYFKTNEFENKKDFESFVLSMVYLNKLNESYLRVDLFTKLNKVKKIVSEFYNDNLSEYKDFLMSIFNAAKPPYVFESLIVFDFYYVLLTKTSDLENIFTLDELSDLIYSYFEKYTRENSIVDSNAFRLYYNNYESITNENRNIIISDRANKLFKDFIEKNPVEYIKELIRPLYSPHDGKTFTLEPFIKQVFINYENFENFLNKQPLTVPVLELRTFFRQYKFNNFQPIEFVRNTIELVSDTETIFVESNAYPDLPRNVKCQEFVHGWTNTIVLNNPQMKNIPWVANLNPLTNQEGTDGGDYLLRRKLEFILGETKIKMSKIELFVDDVCHLFVNEKSIDHNIITEAHKIYVKSINLINGLNTIDFKIINYKGEDGPSNPYGIAYKITITLE